MKVVPFGEVIEDRFETAKQYGLVETIAGIWRMSKKARQVYDPVSFIRFLQGKEEKPLRVSGEIRTATISNSKSKPDPDPVSDPKSLSHSVHVNSRQALINEVLSM